MIPPSELYSLSLLSLVEVSKAFLVSALASNRRTLLLDLDHSVRQKIRFSLNWRTVLKRG